MTFRTLALLFPLVAGAAECDWNSPGHMPFSGDVPAAVERYQDIPADVRGRLRARMERHQYDEVVEISRYSITGAHAYSPVITGMHFGNGRVCDTVNRERWPLDARERGLVYCDQGHCVMVPTVCRNVSRVTRLTVVLMSPAPAPGVLDLAPSAGMLVSPEPAALAPIAAAQSAAAPVEDESFASGAAAASLGGAVAAVSPAPVWPTYAVVMLPPAPTPPVPEPPGWALLLAGLVLLVEDGLLRKVRKTFAGRHAVEGYALTEAGRLAYCLTCEDEPPNNEANRTKTA